MIVSQKKSFLIYKDSQALINKLSDSDAGKLFKAMYSYNKGAGHSLESPLDLLFLQFEAQFDRDSKKYSDTCERNRLNIKKRWGNK